MLRFHPDKAQSEGDAAAFRLLFDAAQKAVDVLSDKDKRRRFESTFAFDDSIPSETRDPPAFYASFGEAFARNARFSETKPVPRLGDASTPDEDVLAFYDFWHRFKSWRDFSGEGEHNLDEAEGREEKRWMERQNAAVARKLKKQENARVTRLVDRAERCDPRLGPIRKRMADERKAAKKAEKERKRREREAREQENLRASQAVTGTATGSAPKPESELEAAWKAFREAYLGRAEHSSLALALTENQLAPLQQHLTAPHLARLSQLLSEANTDNAAIKGCWQFLQENVPKFVDACRLQGQTQWSKEELAALQKAVKKFPGGTRQRWRAISQFVSTAVRHPVSPEACAARIRSMRAAKTTQSKQDIIEKVKAKAAAAAGADAGAADGSTPGPDGWSKNQQSALEKALREYPASMDKLERWNSIAAAVEGKSRKECIQRFKELRAALLSKK